MCLRWRWGFGWRYNTRESFMIIGMCLRLGKTHIPACLSTQETQR